MAVRFKKGEVFDECARLKMENQDLKRKKDHMELIEKASDKTTSCWQVFMACTKWCSTNGTLILLLVALILLTGAVTVIYYAIISVPNLLRGLHKGLSPFEQNEGTFGLRNDASIQDCYAGRFKKTFPDIDYAAYGYNSIKGYPHAAGRDPGFTRPIFKVDYSIDRQTSDCRYAMPKGFVLAPDVSCVTSFTSKTIKDSNQFSKSLSVNAEISGGGWGVSFSASTDYKKKVSEMSASESVYIISEANCNYYFAQLDEVKVPRLDPSFISKVQALDLSKDEDIFGFFDYYGTHFATYILFGARFIYEHKMSKSTFKKESSESTSVNVKASYSGLFSLSGGLGMSFGQRRAAEKFQEQVETSTISVGAPPPANGNTMQWASTVKDTPVPVKYRLSSIENLFTKIYMGNTGLDYNAFNKRIRETKLKYCQKLRADGVVDSCSAMQSYIAFKSLDLGYGYYKNTNKGSLKTCINNCLDDPKCAAVDYHGEERCYFFEAGKTHSARGIKDAQAVLFIDNLKLLDKNIGLENVAIVSSSARGSSFASNKTMCAIKCRGDRVCLAYTFNSDASSPTKNCFIFDESKLTKDSLRVRKNSITTIGTI